MQASIIKLIPKLMEEGPLKNHKPEHAKLPMIRKKVINFFLLPRLSAMDVKMGKAIATTNNDTASA